MYSLLEVLEVYRSPVCDFLRGAERDRTFLLWAGRMLEGERVGVELVNYLNPWWIEYEPVEHSVRHSVVGE